MKQNNEKMMKKWESKKALVRRYDMLKIQTYRPSGAPDLDVVVSKDETSLAE